MKTKMFLKCVIMSTIVLFCTPNFALAETFVVDGITYSTRDNSEVYVKSVSDKEDIVIPESVFLRGKKYTVRVIDTNAFANCENLVSLTLPPTLTYFLGDLDKCYSLHRINICSMYDFMELGVGRSIFRSGVGLYLNGELVTHVDVTNAEPQDALKGYELLKSVTFCNSDETRIKDASILNGCSNIDTLCFKSPYTVFDCSSFEFPYFKNLYFYGDVSTTYSGQFKAKFAYIKESFSCGISYNGWNNTLSADICVIDQENDYFSIPNLSVDTCIITPRCPNKGEFSGNKNPFAGCKDIVFLSPCIRPTVPSDDQTYYIIDKDSATVEWTTYEKKNNMSKMKLICGIKKPMVKDFEYSGQSPLMSIVLNDSTEAVQTTLDVDRLKKDVGDYEEIPLSFNVHGMRFDAGLPYKYSIVKAPLTILANSAKREYGEDNPELSCTYIGLKNGENDDVLEAKPTIYTTASKDSPVGSYPIVPVNAKSTNYSIDYQNGTLTIEPASQEITWEQDLTNVKVGDIVELSATSSANLRIKFRSSNTAIADVYVSEGKYYVEFLAAGTVRITAYQPGDNNHLEADDIVKRIKVEDETTAITHVGTETNKIIGYYTMDGRQVEKPAKGLLIAKYANGYMRKVTVK